MIVDVTCKGLTPHFMNRMSESTLEELRTKVKPPKSAAVKTAKTPREEAERKVYMHGGKPILPTENLMSCLIAAGQHVRLDGKRQVSTTKSTMLPGLMTIVTPTIYLVKHGTKEPVTWEADVRKGTNPNGGEAVAICRPRFDDWAFTFTVEIDETEASENLIRELVDKGGKRIGVGDFRPQRKGCFGQFIVERWERREERAAAE